MVRPVRHAPYLGSPPRTEMKTNYLEDVIVVVYSAILERNPVPLFAARLLITMMVSFNLLPLTSFAGTSVAHLFSGSTANAATPLSANGEWVESIVVLSLVYGGIWFFSKRLDDEGYLANIIAEDDIQYNRFLGYFIFTIVLAFISFHFF